MPVAYSYVRFSSKPQEKGDSIRRQTAARDKWLEANPKVSLDQSMKLDDCGVSAFKGKHLDNSEMHALAAFLHAVKTSRVEPGSFLLVESLDRLSRDKIRPALTLLLNLIESGIKVVQLLPVVMTFDEDVEPMQLMMAVMELGRGHSESKMKSERVGAAWQNKKKNATTKVLTKRLPGWVKYNDTSKKLELIPEKAATIRYVYKLALSGLGANSIAKKLNEEKVPLLARATFKGKKVIWTGATVYFLLTTDSVLGVYQPHTVQAKKRTPVGEPIKDYYPRAISDNDWHAVQNQIKTRSKVGRGKKGTTVNLFAGLIKDARDGGSMVYKHYSKKYPSMIEPYNARHGQIEWIGFNATVFEEVILSELREVKATDINGNNEASRRVESLSGELAILNELIKGWMAKMDNPAIIDTVAAKLAELKPQAKAKAEELEEAQREAASPISESWGSFRSLAALLEKDNSDEKRERVRSELRKSIDGLWCIIVKRGRGIRMVYVQVHFRNGSMRDYTIILERPRSNAVVKKQSRLWKGSTLYAEKGKMFDTRNVEHAARVKRMMEMTTDEEIEKLLSEGR